MRLREITKQLIALLEEKSGCAVHVMEDANLSTMSEIKIARGNLPGEFSGLHLLSIQYVAFKRIAPNQDIGFDLSAEYQAALKLFQK